MNRELEEADSRSILGNTEAKWPLFPTGAESGSNIIDKWRCFFSEWGWRWWPSHFPKSSDPTKFGCLDFTFSPEARSVGPLQRKAACDLVFRESLLILHYGNSHTAEQSKPSVPAPILVNVGTAELEYLSEKNISSGQKQFCRRTTFTEFADNVSHDSIFLQKKKKKANRALEKK